MRDVVPDLVGSGDGIGSNSWVVSGEHTVSGKPLLANDPHLAASLPGVWYQMGLHCRTVDAGCPFDVTGFTFAGLPGVVIGHNRSIAWGMTNLDPDVADLFLEQVGGGGYLHAGRTLPLTEREEVIRIAGQQSKVITVRSTMHGPLLSDVSADVSSVGANASVPARSPPRGNGYAVALSWTALTPSRTADAIFELDRATDWPSFRQAARSFAVPSQNLVYADTAGNIGYQAPGQIPIRKGGRSGDYPAIGWRAQDDWSGRYVPFDQLPSELNPPEGFIVAANQAVTGPDYPYRLGDSYDRGYRSQRIRDLLQGRIAEDSDLDVSDMVRMQLDDRNPMGPVLVPYLMRQLMTSQYYADGQRLLLDWDYSQPADSAAAAYFNVVWSNVLKLTFDDQLPVSLRPQWRPALDRGDEQPPAPSRQRLVGRHPHGGCRGGPRHDPVGGDARRAQRADPQGGREPREVAVGQAAPPRPGEPDARTERVRPARGPVQPRSLSGRWRQRERRRHQLGRLRSATTSTPGRRCGWWWTSPTSTARGGSTSPARAGTRSHAHYTDQTKLWLQGRTLPWAFDEARAREDREEHAGAQALKRVSPSSVAAAATRRSWAAAGTWSRSSSLLRSTQVKVPTGTRPSARS